MLYCCHSNLATNIDETICCPWHLIFKKLHEIQTNKEDVRDDEKTLSGNWIKLEEMVLTCRWLVFALCATKIHFKLALNLDASIKYWSLQLFQVKICKLPSWVAEWIPPLIFISKYSGSNPLHSSLPFSNPTWYGHDLHDVIERFRKSSSGYASIQWVMQHVILLCLFQIIIQQNKINKQYFYMIYQHRGLVVTVSDW